MTGLEVVLSLAVVALAALAWCLGDRARDLERDNETLAAALYRTAAEVRGMIDGARSLDRALGTRRRGGPDDA